MSRIVPEELKEYLHRLHELPSLLPKVLSNRGSDEDVKAVYAAIYVFKPKLDERTLARMVNVLISRSMYHEARELLRIYQAKDVAKAMVVKALTPERRPLVELLDAVDLEALKNTDAPGILRSTADEEILELARKYLVPNTLEERLWVIREVFYGTNDEKAIRFLIDLLKRRRLPQVLNALVDVWPKVDWEYVSKQLGEEDLRRLVELGGRSKKILERIEDVLVDGLMLGRIGQLLHDHPELMPVGEYILEHRLRRRIPEDELRGVFLRALHFFPTVKGLGDKLLYLLSDAIRYAIEHEDAHLLRIAVSQLADLDVHPKLKAKILREALKGIEETDRFFDALDIILRYLVFDERLAAEIVKVVAEVLPDIRAILAVFGDALRRLLSSPAAYEVLEALIESKPGDKALPELLNMVTDERAKIRAAVKLGEDVSKFDPYKVALYAYDLLEASTLKELLKVVKFDESLMPAILKAVEVLEKEDLTRFMERLSTIDVSKAAPIYVHLAARFGDERPLEKLLQAEDVELDYDTAELLVSLAARGMRKAEEVMRKFLWKDSILAAVASIYRGSPKALELAKELAKKNKDAALALLSRAFSGTNDLKAAEFVLELGGDRAIRVILDIAPDMIYVEPLYGKIRKFVSAFFTDKSGYQAA